MDTSTVLIICGIILFVLVVMAAVGQTRKLNAMSPEERVAYQRKLQSSSLDKQHGRISHQIVCPHCQTRGTVRTQAIKKKSGISGGKATAALLTGGVSLLATGLARKESVTQAHCEHCNSVWSF
jgi:hypothetical protein